MRNLLKRRPRDETKPTLRERLTATKEKAGVALRLRPDREADQGRRAVVVGSLAAALPLSTATSPSDLARTCDWGAAHMGWINDPRHADDQWPDERVAAEIARVDAIVERVADQPSQNIGDMAAKARLLLADYGCEISGAHAIPRDRALYRLLSEVGALDARARSPLL